MRIKSFAAAAVGALLWTGPGSAQDMSGPECDSFELERTFESINFVDIGPEGKSPGDIRILKGTLTDKDGNKVGSMHIVASLLPEAGPDGHDLTFAILTEEFPNGTISSSSLTPVPAADDESQGPTKPSFRAVNGGTGSFANVRGTITGTTRMTGRAWCPTS